MKLLSMFAIAALGGFLIGSYVGDTLIALCGGAIWGTLVSMIYEAYFYE